jgi:glycosyltransferase involved in cell wall biosynthesis
VSAAFDSKGAWHKRLYNLVIMLPPMSLVIPAFNEADRIGQTLRDVLGYLHGASPESELIVVNDGSTDATSDVVRKVFETENKIGTRLLENFPNRGKGAAVRLGLLAAQKPIGFFFGRSRDCIWLACTRPAINRPSPAVAARAGRSRF